MAGLTPLPTYLESAGFKPEFAQDCNAVTSFYRLFLELKGSNMDAIIDFMKKWTAPEGNTTDFDYLLSWKEVAAAANVASDNGIEPQFYSCNKTICSNLEFSGNPDIGGVGMVVASCIQAILALIIMITSIIYFYHYRRKDRQLPPLHESGERQKKFGKKMLMTIRGITLDFLDTSAYYNIAITMVGTLIAAKKDSSPYDVVTAFFISFMSIWAYYVVMPFHRDVQDGRRSIFRACGLIITTAFGIAQFALTIKVIYSDKRLGGAGLNFLPVRNWDDFCFQEATGPLFLGMFFFAAAAFLGVFLILIAVNFSLKCCKKTDVIPWRIAISIASAIAYALSILFFFTYQYAVRQFVAEEFDEREWGYGQYLALFTWIPLLLEFLYIFFFGVAKAKEGKLPFPYSVIFVEEKAPKSRPHKTLSKSDLEMTPSSEAIVDQKTPMLTVRPDLPHGISDNSITAVSTSYNSQYTTQYPNQYPAQHPAQYPAQYPQAGQYPNQNTGYHGI